MKYELNKSKSFRRSEVLFAFSNAVLISLLGTLLLYAVSALIIININDDIDIISIKYISIFAVTAIITTAVIFTAYFKMDNGAEIRDDKIVFCVGYWDKYIPIDFPKTYGEIKISDIVDVRYMECFNWRELKKDYKNYNYMWYFIGIKSKNTPVACIHIKGENADAKYMLPLEKAQEFVTEVKALI